MIVEWGGITFKFSDTQVTLSTANEQIELCRINRAKPLHAAGVPMVEVEFTSRAERPHGGMWDDGDRSVWISTEDVV